jgi:hypothetical protein
MEKQHMEILEHKDQWKANYDSGFIASRKATGQFDWKQYTYQKNKTGVAGPAIDLGNSRMAFITTSGGYVPDSQEPFDKENPYGDYSIRTFPLTTPLETIAYSHDHYDQTAVNDDPQVLLPFGHLQTLVEEGIIGQLTPTVISFMGYQPDASRVVDEMFPQILEILQKENAQAALLVPA